jgi:excisionase family DNA binding protein
MPKTKLKVVPIVSTAIPTAAVSAVPINDALLTPEQAAARLQVPPSTIYELTRARAKRRLPVIRVGKYLRFRSSSVDRWLREGEAA